MTAAEYRKWAKDQLESAHTYAQFAKDCAISAKFWFDHRGDATSGETWGDGNERRYDFCRMKFLQFRNSVKLWRRLIAKCVLQHAEYTEKARGVARQEKRERTRHA